MTVAWVDGTPIGADAVDAELSARYRGPGFPAPDTAEGRQLRRWVIQVLVVRALLTHEAAVRGLAASGPATGLDRAALDRAALGSVAAAALAGSPVGAPVFAAVTAAVTVDRSDVDAYRAANPETAGEETRLVRHVRAGRAVNGGRPYPMRRHDLLGDRVFAAPVGAVVTAGPDTLEVVEAVAGPAPDIAAMLRAAARTRAFARWLDLALRDRVVLAAGSEHPADPTQPDHTHRH